MLLKNDGMLPLNAERRSSVAVIGEDAAPGAQTIGGGSGTVTSAGTYTPISASRTGWPAPARRSRTTTGPTRPRPPRWPSPPMSRCVFASDNYGHEEADNTSLNLPGDQDALISAVAAANPHTIVVLNDNSAILMPWLNQVSGVFEGFYDGQEWGQAIAALLFGDVNPSGHLPVTFPTSLSAGAREHRGAVAGHQRLGAVLRGPGHRLPLVRRQQRHTAVPVRVRPVLHHVPLQQPRRRRA